MPPAKAVEPNQVDAVRLLSDKLALRRFLVSEGLSTTRFTCAERPAAVRATLAKFGYPAVLKPLTVAAVPPDGVGGGRGVYLVTGAQHLNGWAAMLDRYGHTGPVLIEEYLRGPVYTVATASHDGEHEIVGITAKEVSLPPLFIEMGHVYPAPLPEARAAAIGALVVEVLRACGHVSGPAHTEVAWTASGPQVIGAQAGPAAQRVRRLAALATGIDTERAIFDDLVGVPSGPARSTAALSYFWLPCGEIESVAGLDQIRNLDYVDELVFPFSPGDRIPETTDTGSRHGHVIVTASSGEEAARRIAEVRDLLSVTLRPRSALAAVPRPRTPR